MQADTNKFLKELLMSPHNAYPPFAKEWTS